MIRSLLRIPDAHLRGAPVLLALALACAPSARATIPCASLIPSPACPADFSVVKRNGIYHVFHIVNQPGDCNFLGHETSTDLYHWTRQPDVLVGTQASAPGVPDGRNGWNRDRVWAPSIVLRDGVYTMFYAGVRQRPSASGCPGQVYQEIGVATSTDLDHWSLALDPWLTPAKVPWTLQDTCATDFGNMRDPSVVRDPASGEWLMLYTTVPSATAVAAAVPCTTACAGGCSYTTARYVLGLAHAPAAFGGAADWTDLEPLWRTYQTFAGSGCYRTLESPHVFRRSWHGSDLWFLFMTAGTGLWATDLVSFTIPGSITADPATWTFRGLLTAQGIHDPYGDTLTGYETYGWVASEYFQDPDDGREYLMNGAGCSIQIREILWRAADPGFDLVEPFHVLSLTADRATAVTRGVVHFTFTGRNCYDVVGPRVVAIEAVRVNARGDSIGTLPSAALGLPATVTLRGDQTVLPWAAREWPTGSTTSLRIRLKDTSTGISTGILTVEPRSGGGGRGPRESPLAAAGAAQAARLDLRAEPGAAGVTLRIGLPESLDARLGVFDLGGRRVRELASGRRAAGASVVTWDLRDASGRRVAPGVYFARLDTARGARTARVAVGAGP